MKVQVENTGAYERKLHFEIPSEIVTQELESSYKELNARVRLKGFRPGKVPRSILQRYYKKQVEEEVLSKLISESYGQAVKDHQLDPVAPPAVIDRTFEEGKEFKVTLTVEVKPEIAIEAYRGLPVEREPVRVTEEEVEAQLLRLQDLHAQLRPLESPRPIREKDFVILDFEGSLAGRPLEGWKANDHLAEVGSRTLAGDLDQKLIGLSAGEEKEVTITLPEDSTQKELAGQTIQVRLRVKEVKEKILPALDDEFAKDVGDHHSLADLKAKVRKNLEEQKRAREDQAAKEKLLTLLIERHPFPIPHSLVERQIAALIARTEQRLARQGLKIEQAGLDREKLRAGFQAQAERDVRSSLILERIAGQEGISVEDEELERRLEQIAGQLQKKVEAVKGIYQREGLLEELRAQLVEEKTLDFLLSKANMIEGSGARPAEPAGGLPEDKA